MLVRPWCFSAGGKINRIPKKLSGQLLAEVSRASRANNRDGIEKATSFFTSATSCPLLGSFRDSSTLGISIFVSGIKFRCIEILVKIVNFI